MKSWKTIGACAALLLAISTTVRAMPIRTLTDRQTVRIHEATFGTVATDFAPNAAALTTRLADPLSSMSNDFTFFTEEYYDAFYSNADGTPNTDGEFLTIEGVWRAEIPFGMGAIGPGGMNINEVELVFGGGNPHSQFGDFVSSFEVGFGDVTPGSEAASVDHNLSSFPRFGQTSSTDLNDRFRLTIGFEGISSTPVPEPSTWSLLVSGVAGLAVLRRKRASRQG